MTEPVYSRFTITSKVEECLDQPTDPSKDPCRVQVEEAGQNTTFLLYRKNSQFFVDTSDASKVAKAFPSFSSPTKQVLDYLVVTNEFKKQFGTQENPADIAKQIKIVTNDGANREILYNYLDTLSNFIAIGRLDPRETKMRERFEFAIQVAIYSFADPVLGTLVVKKLRELQGNPKVNSEGKKRIDWLLSIYEVREKFWGAMKSEFDQSNSLAKSLKTTSIDILTFLFANYILAEKGYKDKILGSSAKDAAKTYYEVMSKLDPNFNPGQNYYAYMAKILPALKSANISATYRSDFEQRLNFLVSEYDKAAKEEMFGLLNQQNAPEALKSYLVFQYGDTPMRKEAMGIILRNTTVKGKPETDNPAFNISMDKASDELQAWAKGQPMGSTRKEALEAVLYLLKTLFEKGGKMKVYWNKQVQEVDNFYASGNFGLVGSNKSSLENLIIWARAEANTNNLLLTPEETPHTSLRKYTLITELGVTGIGVGGYFAFTAAKDPYTRYYGQGGSIILASSALGSAGGNLLSYAVNANKKSFWFDIGGAVVGGILGGVIYGFAVKPPGPGGPGNGGPMDPSARFPTDPYGP